MLDLAKALLQKTDGPSVTFEFLDGKGQRLVSSLASVGRCHGASTPGQPTRLPLESAPRLAPEKES